MCPPSRGRQAISGSCRQHEGDTDPDGRLSAAQWAAVPPRLGTGVCCLGSGAASLCLAGPEVLGPLPSLPLHLGGNLSPQTLRFKKQGSSLFSRIRINIDFTHHYTRLTGTTTSALFSRSWMVCAGTVLRTRLLLSAPWSLARVGQCSDLHQCSLHGAENLGGLGASCPGSSWHIHYKMGSRWEQARNPREVLPPPPAGSASGWTLKTKGLDQALASLVLPSQLPSVVSDHSKRERKGHPALSKPSWALPAPRGLLSPLPSWGRASLRLRWCRL